MKLNKFISHLDENTLAQIEAISKSPALEGENVAIMPDAHFGKGACVGFTSTFSDKLIPNIVGVDVGCGMAMAKLPDNFTKSEEHLKMLQTIIRKEVPSGFNVHTALPNIILGLGLDDLSFKLSEKELLHIYKSVGTLGGKMKSATLNGNI